MLKARGRGHKYEAVHSEQKSRQFCMAYYICKSWGCGNGTENNFESNFREILLAIKIYFSYHIVWKFCTDSDTIIVMPCAYFQNDKEFEQKTP